MKNVYLLCNAHIDPIWLWKWQEGAAEAISTFRTAANFCEEVDGFVFNHNEALLYEWIEEYEPELFGRIQKLVADGKWHFMGGWYLQPDCIMLSGESFIRQIEYGRRYFKEKFDKTPTTAINFDPFGHTRGLVQILKKTVLTHTCLCAREWTGATLLCAEWVHRQREYTCSVGNRRPRRRTVTSWFKRDNRVYERTYRA